MKRILLLVLSMAILVCAVPHIAFAESTARDGHITYTLDESSKKAVVKKVNNVTGEVRIPATVNCNGSAYSVTTIGESAFGFCENLTSVKIPDSVESIGKEAFICCSELESVTIGSGVKTIGDSAFENCCKLTSVKIPNNVESIGKEAFIYCSELESVTIGSGVTTIGDSAFRDFHLKSINVDHDNPKFKSEDGVLFNKAGTELILCPGGKTGSYTVPGDVITIGDSAFQNCRLKSINVNSNNNNFRVKDDVLFSKDGTKLVLCSRGKTDDYMIPSGVITIGNYAFQCCKDLNSVNIPSSVITIGDSAFEFCHGLESVKIGNNVRTIGHSAFGSCSGLTSIEIPNNVIYIGKFAFDSCIKLTSVKVGNSATKDKSVTTIGDHAFWFCSGLTSVTIGSGVKTIGNSAFRCCSGLTSIEIPNSVIYVGKFAFENCSKLTSAKIGSRATIVGKYAFDGCNLASVIIGKGVTTESGTSIKKLPPPPVPTTPRRPQVDINRVLPPAPKVTVDDFMRSHSVINPSLKQNQKGLTCWMFASMNIENYYRVRNHMQPIDGSEVDQACNFVAKNLNRTDILNNTQTAKEMIFYLNKKKISVKDYSFTVLDASEKSNVIGAIESLLKDHFSNPNVQYHPPVAVNQNANHWITIIGINGDDYLVCNSLKDNDEPYFVKKKEILENILGGFEVDGHGMVTDILIPNGIHLGDGRIKTNYISYLPKYGLYYDAELGTIRFNTSEGVFSRIYDIKIFSDNNGKFILDSNKSKRYLSNLSGYIEVVGGISTFKKSLGFTPFYTEKEECGVKIVIPVAGSVKFMTTYGKRSINYFRDSGKYVIFDSNLNPKFFDTLLELHQYVNDSSDFLHRNWRGINDNVASTPGLSLPPVLKLPPPPLTPSSFQKLSLPPAPTMPTPTQPTLPPLPITTLNNFPNLLMPLKMYLWDKNGKTNQPDCLPEYGIYCEKKLGGVWLQTTSPQRHNIHSLSKLPPAPSDPKQFISNNGLPQLPPPPLTPSSFQKLSLPPAPTIPTQLMSHLMPSDISNNVVNNNQLNLGCSRPADWLVVPFDKFVRCKGNEHLANLKSMKLTLLAPIEKYSRGQEVTFTINRIAMLGRGACGTSYLVELSEVPNKLFVIKSAIISDYEAINRLNGENNGVIQHYGITQNGYLLMEYGNGGTLDDILEVQHKKSFKELSSAEWSARLDATKGVMRQLLQGLSTLKKKGITHRDIKPGNIAIVKPPRKECEYKLFDFGISLTTEKEGSDPVIPKGTKWRGDCRWYNAPENHMCTLLDDDVSDIDGSKVDLYGVGCIMLEMLIGESVFFNISFEVYNLKKECIPGGGFVEHRSLNPIVNELLNKCPQNVRTLLSGLLQREPAKRFSVDEALHSEWFKGGNSSLNNNINQN